MMYKYLYLYKHYLHLVKGDKNIINLLLILKATSQLGGHQENT